MFARRKLSRWILVGLTLLLVTACAVQPSSVPDQQGEAPQPSATTAAGQDGLSDSGPEVALRNAWQAFTTGQSYTQLITVTVGTESYTSYDPQIGEQPTTYVTNDVVREFTCFVNLVDRVALNSAFDLQYLQVGDLSYRQDDTGLFKSTSDADWGPPCAPGVSDLEIDFAEFQASSFNYLGEENLDGTSVYKYEMQLNDDQIAPIMDQQDGTTTEFSAVSPQVYVYVEVASQRLLRVLISYDQAHYKSTEADGSFSEMLSEPYQQVADYTNWDNTSFTTPEYVEPGSTETQVYAGQASEYFTFTFPKVYVLWDGEGYLFLNAPSGSSMYLTAAYEFPFNSEEACSIFAYGQVATMQDVYGEAVSVSAYEFIPKANFNICKIVYLIGGEVDVQYWFNHPTLLTAMFDPVTYEISITPAAGEDPTTLFRDVIDTIQFVE